MSAILVAALLPLANATILASLPKVEAMFSLEKVTDPSQPFAQMFYLMIDPGSAVMCSFLCKTSGRCHMWIRPHGGGGGGPCYLGNFAYDNQTLLNSSQIPNPLFFHLGKFSHGNN